MTDISGYERRRIQAELAGDGIDLLIVVELQIDDAVLRRSVAIGMPVLAFERDHPVAGRDVDDALVRPVGARPVGDTSSGAVARRVLAAHAFVLGMHPQQLAGRSIERDDGAPHADRGVEHAADHERRRRVEDVRPRPERHPS